MPSNAANIIIWDISRLDPSPFDLRCATDPLVTALHKQLWEHHLCFYLVTAIGEKIAMLTNPNDTKYLYIIFKYLNIYTAKGHKILKVAKFDAL